MTSQPRSRLTRNLKFVRLVTCAIGLFAVPACESGESSPEDDDGPSRTSADELTTYDANGVAAANVNVTVSGTTASGAYTLKTKRTVTFKEVVLAVRDASNANFDFAWNGNVRLLGSRTFTGTSAGLVAGTYSATVAYTLDDKTWFSVGPKVSFTVGTNTCTPTTCAAQKATCGSISDGCGGTLTCGSCTSPQTCGGGGVANVCGGGGGTTGGGSFMAAPSGWSYNQLVWETQFGYSGMGSAPAAPNQGTYVANGVPRPNTSVGFLNDWNFGSQEAAGGVWRSYSSVVPPPVVGTLNIQPALGNSPGCRDACMKILRYRFWDGRVFTHASNEHAAVPGNANAIVSVTSRYAVCSSKSTALPVSPRSAPSIANLKVPTYFAAWP
jgi:hypothetical protein